MRDDDDDVPNPKIGSERSATQTSKQTNKDDEGKQSNSYLTLRSSQSGHGFRSAQGALVATKPHAQLKQEQEEQEQREATTTKRKREKYPSGPPSKVCQNWESRVSCVAYALFFIWKSVPYITRLWYHDDDGDARTKGADFIDLRRSTMIRGTHNEKNDDGDDETTPVSRARTFHDNNDDDDDDARTKGAT